MTEASASVCLLLATAQRLSCSKVLPFYKILQKMLQFMVLIMFPFFFLRKIISRKYN